MSCCRARRVPSFRSSAPVQSTNKCFGRSTGTGIGSGTPHGNDRPRKGCLSTGSKVAWVTRRCCGCPFCSIPYSDSCCAIFPPYFGLSSSAVDKLFCNFSFTHDLLRTLHLMSYLRRICGCAWEQVVVFDLEYGQPAASTTLPTSRPPFRDVLGCFGHADVGKGLAESGVDLLYTSHQVTP